MQTLRVGIGGPVGSGKTALTLLLCKAMRNNYDMAVVTNDIYTQYSIFLESTMVCQKLSILLGINIVSHYSHVVIVAHRFT